MNRGVALFAAVVTVFTACGSPATQPVDRRTSSRLAAAAKASQSAGAVRIVVRGAQQLEGSTEVVRSSGFGVIDPATQRVQLTMDLGESSATGDLGTAELIAEGLVFYMKSSAIRSLIPDAKPWLKVDLDAVGEKMGIDMSALMQLGGQDPMQLLDFLRGAGDVEKVGRATVRGVKTTHYRAVIDYRRAAELAPPEMRDRVAASIERMIEITGQETAPMGVWIDDSDLIRRVKNVVDTTEMESAAMGQGITTQTFDFVKYGIRADIELPPASRVTDILEWAEQQQAGASS